jgi:hypothetical protein
MENTQIPSASDRTSWFVVLDLSGSREQYASLLDFLGSLGARKIAANTWWFVEDDVTRFEEYSERLWSSLMSTAPNRPFPKDKLLSFAEATDGISAQSSIQQTLVTKSREELIAEGKIVQRR